MQTSYLDFATTLAKDAGVIMKKYFGIGTEKMWKDDNSPITVADKEINDMVVERVKATYPDHSVLGEEGGYEIEGSTYTWACDPIDGTVPFSSGIPISTFSLALVEDGTPVLGVIFDPFSNRLFVAEKGKGATMNGKPIHVSKQSSFEHSYINVESRHLLPLMTDLTTLKAKPVRLYCITAAGVLVAAGEFAATFFAFGNAWDIAALKVIVEEAGGKVTDIYGNEQRYDKAPLRGGIISNGLLHEKLIEMASPLQVKK